MFTLFTMIIFVEWRGGDCWDKSCIYIVIYSNFVKSKPDFDQSPLFCLRVRLSLQEMNASLWYGPEKPTTTCLCVCTCVCARARARELSNLQARRCVPVGCFQEAAERRLPVGTLTEAEAELGVAKATWKRSRERETHTVRFKPLSPGPIL